MDDATKPLNQEEITDGEVVENEVVESETSNAIVLKNLESLIISHLATIEKLQAESKKHREMIESGFVNDATYRDHDEKAKEAAKVRASTKSQIMKQNSVVALVNKLKDIRVELKELQDELSEYLLEYQRMSGATTIEDGNGEVLEIKNSAKVVKTSANTK